MDDINLAIQSLRDLCRHCTQQSLGQNTPALIAEARLCAQALIAAVEIREVIRRSEIDRQTPCSSSRLKALST